MEEKMDSRGNPYIDVGNIRITYVPNTWDEIPGLRVQAYKQDDTLHRGAEIPIPDKAMAFDLLEAILGS